MERAGCPKIRLYGSRARDPRGCAAGRTPPVLIIGSAGEKREGQAAVSVFDTMRVSMTGLSAQRLRMDVIASNVANIETTRTPEGGPYLRRQVIFRSQAMAASQPGSFRTALANASAPAGQGVAVTRIATNADAVREVYDPDHPDADANGMVAYPDIDVVTEMTDMLSATRAYEANVTVLNATKSMALRALQIGRG